MHRALTVRYVAIFLTFLLTTGAGITLSPSHAAIRSTRQATHSVSTASWGAYLAPGGTTPSPGPYISTWTPVAGVQLAYLDLINPNPVALAGENFTLASVEPNSSRQNVPRITFDVCVGATWNQLTDTCAGSITSLGTSTGGTVNSTVSIASQSRLSVRLTVTKVGKLSWTTTINTVITRAQVRAAVTTNS